MVVANHADCSADVSVWRGFARESAQELCAFERSLDQPAAAQRAVFQEVIAAGRDSAFGSAHGFADINSVDAYRRHVPVSRWQDFAAWIDRAQSQVGAILTAEVPAHFEQTSGSAASSKLIPYTPGFLAQLQRAIIVWLAKLYDSCPEIAGPGWWSMSPSQTPPISSVNGIPIGSLSDAVYLQGCKAEGVLGSVIDTRECLRSDDWKAETLARIVARDDLTLISVWSPTFLGALLNSCDTSDAVQAARMREILPRNRFRALLRAIEQQDYSDLWPRLKVISTWADGPSTRYAAALSKQFPQAHIVPKGLFATEGIVSFSWGLTGQQPLAIESHFLEFLDADGNALLVEDLTQGHQYEPVISTAGGLYRYALGDVVEVTDFVGHTPSIRFVGRSDARTDLVGEKLDESIVSGAMHAVSLTDPAVLVPVADASQPHYELIVESGDIPATRRLAEHVERELRGAYHYSIARCNEQLGPLRVSCVPDLSTLLHDAWESLDRQSGNAKSNCLISSEALAGKILTRARALRLNE